MAACIAHYKLNHGNAMALNFWEHFMIKGAEDLHCADVAEICEAFRSDRIHHRDHMRKIVH